MAVSKRLVRLALVVVALCGAARSADAAPLVCLTGTGLNCGVGAFSTTVGVGDTFFLDLRIEQATNFSAYIFDRIEFDTTKLSIADVRSGDFGSTGSFAYDTTTGFVDFLSDAAAAPLPGPSGVLARLEFFALAAGSTSIDYAQVDYLTVFPATIYMQIGLDAFGDPIFGDAAASFLGADITIDQTNVVPEPATLTLLGFGLATALYRRRARTK